MEKQFIALTAAIALLAISLNAQQHRNYKKITLGIVAGVNFQTLSPKDFEGQPISNQFIPGFHIGANTEFEISSHLYLQPGLLYTTKGGKEEEQVYGQPAILKVRISYLEVPVNLLYKSLLGRGLLLFGIGPYFAVGVDGKRKSHFWGNQTINFKSPINTNTHHTETYFKRMDAGGNLLAGYEFRNGISFKLNAQRGLIKINPEYTDYDFGKYSKKNTGFSVSIGYRFL